MALTLTSDERAELERRLRSLKIRAEDARRARVILMLADGASYTAIERRCRVSVTTSIGGASDSWPNDLRGCVRVRRRSPTVLTPTMEARILDKTRQPPPDGSTHWATRNWGAC